MYNYTFFVSSQIERNILNYAKENEEPFEAPGKLSDELFEFSLRSKSSQITFVDHAQGEHIWYTAHRVGDKFLCYELTEDLLRRTDYGMAKGQAARKEKPSPQGNRGESGRASRRLN